MSNFVVWFVIANMGVKEYYDIVKEKRNVIYIIAIYGQITVMLVGPVVTFLLLGLWLDNYFHISPLFTIIGVVVGFIGSIVNVFRVVRKQ